MQIAEVFWTQNAFKEGKLNRCENDEALLLCMSNDANDTLGIIVGSYFATQVSLINALILQANII